MKKAILTVKSPERSQDSRKKGKKSANRSEREPKYAEKLLSAPIFRLLSLLTVAMIGWALANLSMPFHQGILLLSLPLTALGWAIQRLAEKVPPFCRFEKVSFIRGLPGLTLCGLLCLLASGPIHELLSGGLLPEHLDFESWTVFVLGFAFILMASGVYTSMIPTEKFFSYSSSFVFAGIYLVLWVLTFFAPDFPEYVLILPALLITVFFLISLNQSGIDELSRRSRSMGVTYDLRRQNLRLSVLMLLLLGGLFFLSVVVFTGIYFLFKFLGIFLLRALLGGESDSSEDVIPSTSDFFSGGLLEIPFVNAPIFVIFLLLLVIVFVLFCVRMHTLGMGIRLREIPGRVMELFRRLLSLLDRLFKRKTSELKERPASRQPYQDSVSVAAPSARNDAAHSYGEYLRKIREISDEEERFCYAYGTLIHAWRKLDSHHPNALIPSLTPREICRKLEEEGRYSFGQITETYERLRYARKSAEISDLPKLTARLSGYVEQYFRTL